MSLFQGNIHSGVMKVIKQKVAQAQKDHDDEVRDLEAQHEEDIKAADAVLEQGVSESESKHINNIIGKLI